MAVYTDVGDEELTAFIRDYDLGEVVSCKGIAEGVENSNFLLRTETGTFILTLYEKRVDPKDLPFFIALMEHLAGGGLACPTPLRGRDGVALRRLCGRPAAIITFLDGMWPRRVQPFHCAGVGRALAELHLAGSSFPMHRPNNLSLAGWRLWFDRCRARAHEVRDGLRGERVSGLIDFYFACSDFLAYDIAICLNAWCFESDGSFNVTKARLLLSNYRAVRPISAAELAALPLLARGSALRFLLTRLYDWLNQPAGAMVRPKDPLEYLQKLRFHRSVGGPGDYGLT